MTTTGGPVMPLVMPDFGAPDRDEEKTSYDSDEAPVCPPHTTERKLMMKIDARVVPFLCIMYLLAFLDRVNIANANVFDLSKDLKLTDPNDPNSTKYNNALVIFFVPYCLLEIPSNILLKKFKPHVWLSINMFLFGLTTMCQGFVQNYGGLLATRFFLGVFETGMFPGAFYLIGMWYKRSEAQRRFSFFFNSTTLAGAFGGLLAAAIGKMSGLRGYSGWRWIFILEGLLTVIVAIFFFFLIPDFPEDVKWLDEEERKFVKARLRADVGRSAAARKVTMKDVKHTLLDWKIIAGGFCYFGLIVPAYGYAYFAPAIIQKLGGYGAIQTQLMSVPPWAFAFVFSMVIATLSDKTHHRVGYAVLTLAVAIAGFAMLLKIHDRTTIEYIALFFVTSGAYTAMPIIVCWFNMNLGGHHRRSIGSAWQVGFGNLGGIIAVYAFLNSDKKNFYAKGHTICLSFCALSFLSCMIYGYLCLKANRDRDAAPPSTLTEEEKEDLGDHSPDYRYLL